MGDKTGIEWTDATWNPLVGCKAVSPGCDHCYAARETSGRLRHLPQYEGLAEGGVFTGEVRLLPERLDQPLHWKRPRRIFVNSMSDLFHHDVPQSFQHNVFAVMETATWHTFQVLTKRPEIMRRRVPQIYEGGPLDSPGAHIWLGTSIENKDYKRRIGFLRNTPAGKRFLSCEPLLGDLELDAEDLEGIDWVIVGGESGSGARPMNPDWARSIRDMSIKTGTPFLFKQWGQWAPVGSDMSFDRLPVVVDPETHTWRAGKKVAGRELDGRTWDEYPEG